MACFVRLARTAQITRGITFSASITKRNDSALQSKAWWAPRIWERLYRGDKSRSQRGLGLGLSLVRAIINAHGGRIELQSEVGKGSSFTVHLANH